MRVEGTVLVSIRFPDRIVWSVPSIFNFSRQSAFWVSFYFKFTIVAKASLNCLLPVKILGLKLLLRSLRSWKNLESYGILHLHFPGLESHGKLSHCFISHGNSNFWKMPLLDWVYSSYNSVLKTRRIIVSLERSWKIFEMRIVNVIKSHIIIDGRKWKNSVLKAI